MKKDITKHDYLKCELFEVLLPQMLYEDEREQTEETFQYLLEKKSEAVYELYAQMCEEDKVKCPYRAEDFAVEEYVKGAMHFIRITVSGYNPKITNILQVNILSRMQDGIYENKKYFMTVRFKKGDIYNIYVPSDGKIKRGEVLEESRSWEEEEKALTRDYVRCICLS